jgi:tRNA/rRNA methyltransferase
MQHDHISIVLCRPEGSVNIGAVCRAMKTMGLTKLKIVAPASEICRDEVKKWGLKAFDIFERALFYTTLADAVGESTLIAGVSRRQGKRRKHFYLLPDEFAKTAVAYGGGPVDIVFGNEQNGLNDEELTCCQHLLTIPSDENFPSLNLSHAVQIICYEIMRCEFVKPKRFHAVSASRLAALSRVAADSLSKLGFFVIAKETGYEESKNFWYTVLGRAGLTGSEEKFLYNFFNKIAHIDSSHYKAKEQTAELTAADAEKLNRG